MEDARATQSGRRTARLIRRGLAAAVALYLLSGFYAVRPGQQVVIRRLGKALRPPVRPGLHYSLPWPIARRSRVRVDKPRRVTVGFAALDQSVGASSDPRQSRFLTGDENVVQVQMVVEYVVDDPAAFLFRVQDTRRVVEATAQHALAEVLAGIEVDDILTKAKTAIAQYVKTRTQRSLNGLKAGINVVSITFPAAEPPAEVSADFHDVASAREDYYRIINEAEAYAAETVPKAHGEASRMLADAQGYKAKVTNEAEGDAAYFSKLRAEYARAREVTSARLYAESMERLLPKMRVIVADESEENPLDLSVVRNEP